MYSFKLSKSELIEGNIRGFWTELLWRNMYDSFDKTTQISFLSHLTQAQLQPVLRPLLYIHKIL